MKTEVKAYEFYHGTMVILDPVNMTAEEFKKFHDRIRGCFANRVITNEKNEDLSFNQFYTKCKNNIFMTKSLYDYYIKGTESTKFELFSNENDYPAEITKIINEENSGGVPRVKARAFENIFIKLISKEEKKIKNENNNKIRKKSPLSIKELLATLNKSTLIANKIDVTVSQPTLITTNQIDMIIAQNISSNTFTIPKNPPHASQFFYNIEPQQEMNVFETDAQYHLANDFSINVNDVNSWLSSTAIEQEETLSEFYNPKAEVNGPTVETKQQAEKKENIAINNKGFRLVAVPLEDPEEKKLILVEGLKEKTKELELAEADAGRIADPFYDEYDTKLSLIQALFLPPQKRMINMLSLPKERIKQLLSNNETTENLNNLTESIIAEDMPLAATTFNNFKQGTLVLPVLNFKRVENDKSKLNIKSVLNKGIETNQVDLYQEMMDLFNNACDKFNGLEAIDSIYRALEKSKLLLDIDGINNEHHAANFYFLADLLEWAIENKIRKNEIDRIVPPVDKGYKLLRHFSQNFHLFHEDNFSIETDEFNRSKALPSLIGLFGKAKQSPDKKISYANHPFDLYHQINSDFRKKLSTDEVMRYSKKLVNAFTIYAKIVMHKDLQSVNELEVSTEINNNDANKNIKSRLKKTNINLNIRIGDVTIPKQVDPAGDEINALIKLNQNQKNQKQKNEKRKIGPEVENVRPIKIIKR